jgi:hypothetical protein
MKFLKTKKKDFQKSSSQKILELSNKMYSKNYDRESKNMSIKKSKKHASQNYVITSLYNWPYHLIPNKFLYK